MSGYSATSRENELGEDEEGFSSQANALLKEHNIAKRVAPEREKCNLESQYHTDQGIRILRRYPNQIICDPLFDRYFVVCNVMLSEPTNCYCQDAIWSTYGSYLRELRTDEIAN